MRKQSLLFICIFISFFEKASTCSYLQEPDPLLAIVIMVKNEAEVIEATLQPFFDAGIQHYLIFDTGSTDNTVSLTLDLFSKNNIEHGYVVEKPFINFATSRNDALNVAEEIFPHAAFFFMIDAEWYMRNVNVLLEFCQSHLNCPQDLYYVRLGHENFKNYIPRLFKAHKEIRFCGAVHEYINKITYLKVPDEAYIYWNPSRNGIEKSTQRWHRDCDLLLKEHEKDPSDPRTVFYLAQSYACLKNHEQAQYWYEKRCAMNGFYEENYIAHVRVAQAYKDLGNWPQALFYYIKAYSMNPKRVEPLVAIARYYLKQNNFIVSYMFALQAVKIQQSDEYILFIEQIDYDFNRYDILGIAAWYIGEYEIGKQAVLKALQYSPHAPHLLFNLSLYEEKLPSLI